MYAAKYWSVECFKASHNRQKTNAMSREQASFRQTFGDARRQLPAVENTDDFRGVLRRASGCREGVLRRDKVVEHALAFDVHPMSPPRPVELPRLDAADPGVEHLDKLNCPM